MPLRPLALRGGGGPRSALAAASIAALMISGAAAPATARSPAADAEALDRAFAFATAIVSDDEDRGKAQESVVLDYLSIGAVDEALERARRVDGWRRGTALADLATSLAKMGRIEKAKGLVDEADELRKSITGWQERRIAAHLAQALAATGDLGRSQQLASELAAADRQYAGQAVAVVASGRAARGEFAKAMDDLRALDKERDIDVAWWRTAGYLEIARRDSVAREERRRALGEARRSAEGITGWKRAEALQSIAAEMRLAGEADAARAALDEADGIVVTLPDTLPVKGALLSNLARAWAGLGEERRARGLLKRAEAAVPDALVIDRPGIQANLATSYLAIGDERRARAKFDRALASAEKLENARPRALASVEICRAMGRNRFPLDSSLRARLERLLGGLKEPW